jgi:DNA primase
LHLESLFAYFWDIAKGKPSGAFKKKILFLLDKFLCSPILFILYIYTLSKLTDDILTNVDIIDVINRYVPLKRAGANFTACCPFHNEKTPSFMVSPSKQIFKCFGCGKGGNVITFVQEIERIDFWDAAKELAKQANIDLTKYQIDPKKHNDRQDEKEKIKRIHKLTQKFFVEQLEKNSSAKTYLKKERKLDEKTIKEFGIGYAPDSHYALTQELKSKGFSDQDIIEASLAKKSPTSGDVYAFFRNRITFPIYDTMNNIIGFSARIVDPNDKPKYLNSAEHKAFQKSQVLYGLNRVKQEIKEHDAIFIVEGQMDVIGLARL